MELLVWRPAAWADHVVEGSQCHGPLPVPDVLSACRDLKAVNDFEKTFSYRITWTCVRHPAPNDPNTEVGLHFSWIV